MSTITYPVKLRLKDPSSTDDQGRLYPGNLDQVHEIQWVTNPDECKHDYTACVVCLNDWAQDHFGTIEFPDNPCTLEQLQDAIVETIQQIMDGAFGPPPDDE